ncbi:MAG: hypothetical protein P1V34_11145 [Alphaproteobacteria bacterium]|nr:hypothetical protein [Alphaproteobacteria bacterium]
MKVLFFAISVMEWFEKMDRESLRYLLSSGKFLCFNPAALEGRVDTSPASGSAGPPLFDSPYLTNAVFFKESAIDYNNNLSVQTRALLVFNENNAHEGGASVLAMPDLLEQGLIKWFGGKVPISLSLHDRNVLEVFCRTPTFDPFLLMARRSEVEQVRAVDASWFSVDLGTAKSVRGIVTARAEKLVSLALDSPESDSRRAATVESLEQAVWLCEANEPAMDLFQSLGVQKAEVNRILFAWKGIAYYEYLFANFGRDYKNFLNWLRGDESLPNDIKTIPSDRTLRLKAQRRNAQTVMRGYYNHATEILTKQNQSDNALVSDGDPQPFQKFLLAAPNLFETLGMAIGAFAHTSNAWKSLTNDGRRETRGADALEGLFRFIINLAASKHKE